VLAVAGVCLAGCGPVIDNPNAVQTETKPTNESLHLDSSLSLLAREGFLAPSVLNEFTHSYGVAINVKTYATLEELYQLVRTGQYDLGLMSGTPVESLIAEGALAELDHGALTNLHNLEHVFERSPIDPEHHFAIPYMWQTIGIGYNIAFDTDIPLSWKDLLEPRSESLEKQHEMKQKIAMFNEGRYVIGAALIYLGLSPNTRDPEQIAKAADLLKRQRPFVMAYEDRNAEKYLASGKAILDQAWSSDIARARKLNPKVRYSIPKEGVIIFMDHFVTFKKSTRRATAHHLIDYLLLPSIAARNSNYSLVASADHAARPFIDREVLNGPAYELPENEDLMFFLQAVDPTTSDLYERIWQEVKTSE